MNYKHQSLAGGRWNDFSLIEQMAHIGSEVERAINWRQKNKPEYSRMAFERGLELLELTIADPRNRHRLKELTRLREALLDYFMGDNQFCSSEKSWKNYFYAFAYAVSISKGK
jgi:hypothetical protein